MSTSSDTVEIKSMPIYSGEQIAEWMHQQKDHHRNQFKNSSAKFEITKAVAEIIETVANEGDEGIRKITQRLGDKPLRRLTIGPKELEEVNNRIHKLKRDVIQIASRNINTFNEKIMRELYQDGTLLGLEEYECGALWKPVRRVGCYVPGGRYPLASTALMTAMTARAAGVEEICIVSPNLSDEVILAGTKAGVSEFYEIGGAQAVAALALGTDTIEAVDMIVGPGNAYVTEAKRQVFGVVGIDMLAGPSEVAVIADGGANPEWVALDLLAQAEHDPSSRVYLLTSESSIAEAVQKKLVELVAEHPYPEFVPSVLTQSAILVVDTLEDCARLANEIAPEHLELMIKEPSQIKRSLKNYGACFMGYNACVPFGDYIAGPNHTLPTNKSARFAGGLNPFTFLRLQTEIRIHSDYPPDKLAARTARFAEIEGLKGHALAALSRSTKK